MSQCSITCRTCGNVYLLSAGEVLRECAACGTVNERPQATGEALDRLQRATRLRLQGEFGEALKCYEIVLVEYDDEHEALWGKLLCQYGVEFVADPRTGARHATVHVPRSRPMQLHADYARACELAPEPIRAQYEAEAAYVDAALAEIRRRTETEPPYDVFICHKTTPLSGGGYTEDYNRGMKLARRIEKAGYSVFFAPFADLTPGASYEAGIYHALSTAKVMLLIASDAAHLTSPWVKSEWSRFLEMLDDGADKHLIPLMYGGLSDARMPKEIRLRALQSIRMEDFDAAEKVMAALARYTGKAAVQTATAPAPVVEQPKPQPVEAARVAAENPRTKVVPTISDVVTVPSQKPEPNMSGGQQTETVRQLEWTPEQWFSTASADGGVRVTGYFGSERRVVIPPVIRGQRVVKIGRRAFKEMTMLTKIVIPDGVTTIENDAFSGCRGLSNVVIPASVAKIGQRVFENCPPLYLRVRADSVAHSYARQNNLRFEVVTTPPPQLVAPRPVSPTPAPQPVEAAPAQPVVNQPVQPVAPAQPVGEGLVPSRTTVQPAPAYAPASHFTTEAVEGGVAITKYTGPGGEVLIPPTIGGKSVVAIGKDAFQNEEGLAMVVIPEGVTSVGKSAFYGCRSLTSVSIPESVTSIGGLAFEGCSSLMSVNIPDGVTSIGGNAFSYCSSLTSVSIPDSVTDLEGNPFVDCQALISIAIAAGNKKYYVHDGVLMSRNKTLLFRGNTLVCYPAGLTAGSYTIPAGVTSIGISAFYGCRSLTSVSIPESVTSIGDYAFAGCSGLTSVNIPAGVTSIGISAFDGCSGLTSVNIPAGVTSIENYAFAGCSGLTSVNIPAGVTSIESSAFDGCRSLMSVSIPESVTNLGSNPFADCQTLTSIAVAAGNKKYYVRDGVLMSRDNSLVCYPAGLTARSYTIPAGVTSIGGDAFAGCRSLTSVSIPESVTSIGGLAFEGCSGLTSVSIPTGVTSIGNCAFEGCRSLTLCVHPNTPAHAYARQRKLRFELIASAPQPKPASKPVQPAPTYAPESHFATAAVEGGVTITKYTGPGGEVRIPPTIGGKKVVEIGGGAFGPESFLTSVSIPESVTSIRSSTFAGCRDLTSVSIPEGVTSIGENAFAGCISLTSVHIPASITKLENKIFLDCSALTDISVAAGNKKYYARDGVLMSREHELVCYPAGLTARIYSVPDGVTRIGAWAFADCSELASVGIPASVTSIGTCAFSGCSSLYNVSIPAKASIGDSAFSGCTNLPFLQKMKLKMMGAM